MELKEYTENALVTESADLNIIKNRLTDTTTVRLLHAALGMHTESAEFADALKKNIFYGKPLDTVNLAEEIGDLLWYVAIASDALAIPLEKILENNIAKLRKRYGEKFTEKSANTRDLEAERAILDKLIK